jgi:succinoglycan biosynthesis transport protein ExoP
MQQQPRSASPSPMPSLSGDSPVLPSTDGPGRSPQSFEPNREGLLDKTWRIVRHQWFIVLQAVIVTAALALVFSLTREKEYAASAGILFRSAPERILGDNQGGVLVDPNREAATNEGLLSLGVVARGASKRLNDELSPGEVASAIEIVSRPESDIVDVEATTRDPQLSARVANAYASAFIEFRQGSARRQIQDAIKLGRAELKRIGSGTREARALRARIRQLRTAKSLQTGGAELVQLASAPAAPSSPKPVRNGIVGAMLGAILGLLLAALRERRSGSVKSVDEIGQVSDLPILALVPRSRELARLREFPARGVEAEAFRRLRTSLRYFSVKREIRSVLITSARPGEGRSTTAHELAHTMAAMGDRVALVDADMQPGKDDELEGVTSPGLSGVLIGADLDDALLEVVAHGAASGSRSLTVLPRGPLPPNPAELLESEGMRAVMAELQARFDLVILDTPPVGILTDALALLRDVSGVIVVTAIGKTTHEGLRDVSRQIRLLGGNPLGVVVNFAPPPSIGRPPPTTRGSSD